MTQRCDGPARFSQAVIVDKTLYTSGQIGLDPATGDLVPGGIHAQAEQVTTQRAEILSFEAVLHFDFIETSVHVFPCRLLSPLRSV